MSDPRFLVAIPVYNEETFVERVLDQVGKYEREILVIDDGSTDSTGNVLAGRSGMHLIRHPENRGYGQSLADAFRFALRRGYDWLITMDCDEQHEPSFLPKFRSAAMIDNADIISGSRYLQSFDGNSAPPDERRKINAQITRMLNRRLELGITDAFCGFKAYRVSALARFRITVPGYAMPMQFWVQASRMGSRIVEIPVRLIYNDPNRHFGGLLDDPKARLDHYISVFESEMGCQPLASTGARGRLSCTEPCF